MKIVNYKKKNSNSYKITLSSGESVILYEDIILKYNLLLKKEISDNDLKEITKDNEKYFVYYDSLKYITKKLRTEIELRKKYKDYPSSSIDYSINRLRSEGYLNDSLYIKSFINDSINLKMDGQNKIKNNLIKLGLKEEDILDYLDTIDNSVWLEKINKIINKEIKNNKKYSGLYLKNRIFSNLKNLGYLDKDIISILNNYTFQVDESIYEREKEKAINKYKRKYQGKELEMKVNNYLYTHGFREY